MLKLLCSCGAPGTTAGSPDLVLCRLCLTAWDERCRRENCPGCYICLGDYWHPRRTQLLAGSLQPPPAA